MVNPPSPSGGSVTRRNPALVVLLTLITFGIYGIYWLVATTNELRKNTKSAPNPLLLLFLLVPLVNIVMPFYYYARYCKAMNELTGFNSLALFVVFIFFSPAGMAIAQVELNKKA